MLPEITSRQAIDFRIFFVSYILISMAAWQGKMLENDFCHLEMLSIFLVRGVRDTANWLALTTKDIARSIVFMLSISSENRVLTVHAKRHINRTDPAVTGRSGRQRVHLQMPPVSWRRQVSREATVHTVRSIRWNYRGTERHSNQAGSARAAVNKTWGAGQRERETSLRCHRQGGDIRRHRWLSGTADSLRHRVCVCVSAR